MITTTNLSAGSGEAHLDETEFNERLNRAMSAKTRGDLDGLLIDLPHILPPPELDLHQRRGRSGLLVIVMVLLATVVSSALWTWHFPWILFAIIFFIAWRRSRRGGGWHRHCHSMVGSSGGDPAMPGGRPPGPDRTRYTYRAVNQEEVGK
jgi:hypothetical protein